MSNNTLYKRGYQLADAYIRQGFKNIEESHAKDEDFNRGYQARLREETGHIVESTGEE